MSNIAGKCVEDIKERVARVPALKGKILFVLDEDDMIGNFQAINKFPAVGIVYEGIRSTGEEAQPRGLSGILVLSLYIVTQGTATLGSADSKVNTIELLDDIRREILDQRSPSGHKWKFVVEAAAAKGKNDKIFWLQRWQTPVQLIASKPS